MPVTVKKKSGARSAKGAVRKTGKAATKKASVKKPRVTAIKEAYTKSQLINELSMMSELDKKEVLRVMDSLTNIMHRHLKKGGVGHFSLAGLMKLKVVKKPARKAGKGRNPFTGEEIMLKAKPASRSVKVQALKKLKEMAN
ncbi:MAG: integration host factor [Gammaproteobacteria bacterium]|nr:integration host factor [Gammaproteobacteria bacterium]